LSPISCVPKPKVLWGWKRRSEPHAAPRHPPNPLGEAEEGQGAEGREFEKYIGKGVTNALFQDASNPANYDNQSLGHSNGSVLGM